LGEVERILSEFAGFERFAHWQAEIVLVLPARAEAAFTVGLVGWYSFVHLVDSAAAIRASNRAISTDPFRAPSSRS
jgi:hypothetical protein